ncbi:signal peptidase II [Amphritea pacifica]|uniref:signal peptidase II n=1 Tax=Amphritea pacifica TaxID=2811233 RepID=UPI001965A230|nr:signal peptidase II [Amphritea pacifica]MBN1008025.1 signal peptidase II [Amphritea pacifica]
MGKAGTALTWLWLVVLVVALDLFTKHQASTLLSYGVPHPLLPVFDLTLLHNTGAAFSFLAQAGGWQRWFFALIAVVVSTVLLLWMASTPRDKYWLGAGLALVLGGALGNLYDRVVQGYVIDFISLHYNGYYFPAFNLADSAITIGAGMLIIDMLWFSDSRHKSK